MQKAWDRRPPWSFAHHTFSSNQGNNDAHPESRRLQRPLLCLGCIARSGGQANAGVLALDRRTSTGRSGRAPDGFFARRRHHHPGRCVARLVHGVGRGVRVTRARASAAAATSAFVDASVAAAAANHLKGWSNILVH